MPAPSHGSVQQKKIIQIHNDWEMDIGMGFTGAELRKVRAFISSYRECFALKFTDLKGYKGEPVRMQLKDDHPIFRRPYKLSFSERERVKLWCKELVDRILGWRVCMCHCNAGKEGYIWQLDRA